MGTAPRPDPAAPYWDVREVAAELGLRPTTVYDLIASGRLACYRFGPRRGRIRVKPADVAAYAESCRVGARVGLLPPPPTIRVVRPKYDHGF